MSFEKIKYLDYRDEKHKDLAQRKLMKLPFFAKYYDYSQITLEMLEKAVKKIEKKYPVMLSYILADGRNIPGLYSIMLKNSETHDHITSIYCMTLREGFEKVVLYLYYYCQKHFEEDDK